MGGRSSHSVDALRRDLEAIAAEVASLHERVTTMQQQYTRPPTSSPKGKRPRSPDVESRTRRRRRFVHTRYVRGDGVYDSVPLDDS